MYDGTAVGCAVGLSDGVALGMSDGIVLGVAVGLRDSMPDISEWGGRRNYDVGALLETVAD